MFRKKNPVEQELKKLAKKEEKLILKKQEIKQPNWTQEVMKKIPEGLQEKLNYAFLSAFRLIFEKGTEIIEKTYSKKKQEDEFLVNELNNQLKNSRKTVRAFSKKAGKTGLKNQMLSGISGIGMGVLGMGLPDIALLSAMILKSIYEIAISFGYSYHDNKEKGYILLLIQGAMSTGDSFIKINERINHYFDETLDSTDVEMLIEKTAEILAEEMLVMKFIQGIPIAGVVGGVNDIVIMKKITDYVSLKYQQRFLRSKLISKQKEMRSFFHFNHK